VFVPGLNNSASAWRDVRAELPSTVRGIAVNCPPPEDIDAVADALLAELPDRFVAVGHSFGGYVAVAMLARGPGRVAGLVLVNTSDNADTPEQAAVRRSRAAEVRAGDESAYEAMAMSLAARAYHPDHAGDEQLLADRLAGVREYGARRYASHLIACSRRPDRSALLAATAVPVLVLAADHDQAVPAAEQQKMAARIGATLRIVPTAGHMLPAEQPAAVAQAIAAFAGEVASR
jgi:pimeloyl-ACP methyl ester carboxylesterase